MKLHDRSLYDQETARLQLGERYSRNSREQQCPMQDCGCERGYTPVPLRTDGATRTQRRQKRLEIAPRHMLRLTKQQHRSLNNDKRSYLPQGPGSNALRYEKPEAGRAPSSTRSQVSVSRGNQRQQYAMRTENSTTYLCTIGTATGHPTGGPDSTPGSGQQQRVREGRPSDFPVERAKAVEQRACMPLDCRGFLRSANFSWLHCWERQKNH